MAELKIAKRQNRPVEILVAAALILGVVMDTLYVGRNNPELYLSGQPQKYAAKMVGQPCRTGIYRIYLACLSPLSR